MLQSTQQLIYQICHGWKRVFIPPVSCTFNQSSCLLFLSLCKSIVICEPLRDIKKQRTALRPWGARKLCLPKPTAGGTGPLHGIASGQHLLYLFTICFWKKPPFQIKKLNPSRKVGMWQRHCPASHLTIFLIRKKKKKSLIHHLKEKK